MNREAKLRAELVAVGERLDRAGLVHAGEGNFSARLDGDSFLITPRSRTKGHLHAWELVRALLVGALPPEASSEGRLHQAILRTHPGVAAVVHAHPPRLLRQLRMGTALDPKGLKEAAELRLAVLPDLPPGSAELAEAAAEAVAVADVLLLPGHGAVAVGGSVREALWRLETVELVAWVCGEGWPDA